MLHPVSTGGREVGDLDRGAKIEIIARAVHEAIRAHQAALGDAEARPWATADWERDATREAVEFALENPTPGAQHEAWCAMKRRSGWRFGETRDDEQRTHPSMVPFEKLSAEEQRKDAIVVAVSQALKGAFGL
jgi:hypothetical protein